jgi:hypothetical protein
MFAHFTHFIQAGFRFFLFALSSALCFFALFLLPRLFLLTFGKCRSASWHSQSPNVYFTSPRQHGAAGMLSSGKPLKLPAGFPGLACMALVVVASTPSTATAAATKALSAATPWPVSFRLGFVDGQGASPEFGPIQCGDGFFGFAGIGHLHKPETSRPASFAIGYDAHLFHVSMSLEDGAQLGFGCTVGQIANVKVFHISSFWTADGRDHSAERLAKRVSISRVGDGLSRIAFERAWDRERTAEIRRDASRIPQRCRPSAISTESAALTSSQ